MESAAVVIIPNKNLEVLILKRSSKCSYPGKWNFIGGKIELGETTKEGAKREVLEEAGIEVSDLEFILSKKTNKFFISFFVAYNFEGNVIINDESTEYKWVKIYHLNQYEFIDNKTVNLIAEKLKEKWGVTSVYCC